MEPSPCGISESLRIELDQSELRQQELLVQIQDLSKEAADLKFIVKDLKEQLAAQKSQLQDRVIAVDNKNTEFFSELEKDQQMATCCDAALKIQELLDKLKTSEEKMMEARAAAEDRTRESECLSKDLKLRDEELKNSKEKLAEVQARAHDEQEEAMGRLEELQGVVSRIQGALTSKEKETGNLRTQLLDLQASLDCRERRAEELKKRLQEEREEEEQRSSFSSGQDDRLESLILDLRKKLKNREKELAVGSERINHLEEQVAKLNKENESLSSKLTNIGVDSSDQTRNDDDLRTQCNNLMEINSKLLQTIQNREDGMSALPSNTAALLDQLASLRASENHLRSKVEAANMCLEAREERLLDKNLHLEETVQKAFFEKEKSDVQLKKMENERKDLLEVLPLLHMELSRAQQELHSLSTKATVLEQDLMVSKSGRAELHQNLQETNVKLTDQTLKCELLHEKTAAEINEKLQRLPVEQQCSSEENKENPYTLMIAEAQMEFSRGMMQQLQQEVVELRAQLLTVTEERVKLHALQEVTEASKEDLRLLVEQLKAQVEDLNRQHVDEILRSREREEALVRERDGEAQARAGLASEVTASREQLDRLKLQYEALCLENSETKEALHRANTETAELGVHVCTLTAENEEANVRWEDLSTSMHELEEKASQEADRLNDCIEELKKENQDLLHQLHNEEGLLAVKQELQKLKEAQQEAEMEQRTNQEEIQTLHLQCQSKDIAHSSQLQVSHKQVSLTVLHC